MKYTHYLYKLPNEHTIVTPHGKEINIDEYNEYFEISMKWLKEVRPKVHKEIKASMKESGFTFELLNKMFDAYLFDPVKGGVQPRYFLDKRTIAFIFVVSYLIQKESKKVNPLLAHVMGNALLLWLPTNHGLIEHYLAISAESHKEKSLSDGFLLVRLYCPNLGFGTYGFNSDIDKALKYAKTLYNNPLNKHRVENYDYAYARALFEKDKRNADECIKIIDKKLNKYNIEWEDYTNVLLNYLLLELEISSKVQNIDLDIDLLYAEGVLAKEGEMSRRRNEGFYWLAKCYIEGKNNIKSIKKAIELIGKINDPDLYKKAGTMFAKLYLEGNGVELDVREAYDIACLADVQASIYPWVSGTFDSELDKTIEEASKKMNEEKYARFVEQLIDRPVHCVNEEALNTLFRFHLDADEYAYLVDKYDYEDKNLNIVKSIFRKLRHPVVKKEIANACNRMVYIGTDESGYEGYLNFDECGNMLIHGTCGAGKTWYLYSIYKRLKNKQILKKVNMAFWSFKPFEFEGWCDDYLVKDAHEFINTINNYSKQSDKQTIIFIDEFVDFLWNITDEEKNILIDLFKNAKERNVCFICCSQNMTTVLEEFGQFASTKICMMCINREQSNLMIGKDVAESIDKYGNMFVLNSLVNSFIAPKKMKVVKNCE